MANFNELIRSGKPVLVDFFATWCGPCKAQAPILDQLASRIGDAGHILKVDVDRNPKAASVYGVQAVPTLLLFKNGEIVWRHSGVLGAAELETLMRTHA
jgi:thioredoxin 1